MLRYIFIIIGLLIVLIGVRFLLTDRFRGGALAIAISALVFLFAFTWLEGFSTHTANTEGDVFTPVPTYGDGNEADEAEDELFEDSPNTASDTSYQGDVFLTNLDLIDQGKDVSLDETLVLGGMELNHSIRYHPARASTGKVAYVTYDIRGAYSVFRATVGVNDDAEAPEQIGTFAIILDGAQIGTWSATFGAPVEIETNVTGGTQLRLEWTASGSVGYAPTDDADSGETGGEIPDLVWGAPMLY